MPETTRQPSAAAGPFLDPPPHHRRIPLQTRLDACDLADRYRMLIEVLPDGLLVHQDRRIVYVNPAAQRMLGGGPGEILGREITDFVPPEHHARLLNRVATLTEPGTFLPPTERTIQRLDGGIRRTEATAAMTLWEGRPALQVLLRDLTEQRATEAVLRYQAALVEHVSEAIIATSVDGVVTSWNPAAEQVFAIVADAVVGRRLSEVLGPELDPATLVGRGAQQVSTDRTDGALLTVRAAAAPLGDGTGFVLLCSDDSARTDAEQRFSAVISALEEGVVTVDATGAVQSINPAAQRILGRTESELVGRPAAGLPLLDTDGTPLGHLNPLVITHLSGRAQQGRAVVVDRPDGSRVWLTAHSRPLLHRPACPAVMSFTDVTERRAAAAKLQHAATHDPLTGLPNRAQLLDRLAAVRAQPAPPAMIALLSVDLDNFKALNDTAGHALGDEALQLVAKRLAGQLRDADVVARIGSDEFVVLASVSGVDDAQSLAGRVLSGLTRPATGRLRGHPLRASIGIVTATPTDPRSPIDLLRDADAALNQAKTSGPGRIAVFDAELRADVLRRVQLETDLRDALAGSGLWVAYQPLVELPGGRWVGAEALSRWNHPTLGFVPPLEFVSIAEQSDLIHALGQRTLATACRDTVTLRATGSPDLRISVNVSVRQLDDPDLVTHVQDILTMSGLPAAGLCLEVTESSLALDEVRAGRSLHPLRELGVRVAIDDFGTGYSSLARLRTLPVDELKIDRSFVTTLPDDRQSRHVVAGIITLAHALDMEVVAEGVETAEHAEILADLQCDLAQGYHFGRPVRVTDFSPPQ